MMTTVSALKTILDRLSDGSYSRREDKDIKKVIAERDALEQELKVLSAQFNEMFEMAKQIAAAKEEMATAIQALSHENTLLRAALGEQTRALGTKN